VDLVVIPPSVPDLRDVAGFFEVIDDLCRGSLGDADGKGDIPETRRWIAGDRFEHVSVVRDEPPAVEVVCSCPRHLMAYPSCRSRACSSRASNWAMVSVCIRGVRTLVAPSTSYRFRRPVRDFVK